MNVMSLNGNPSRPLSFPVISNKWKDIRADFWRGRNYSGIKM